ncbi:glycerol-3-phosphate acyltransferase [Chloroflexota bacterium]
MLVNEAITRVIVIIIAYLIGSIPFAYIFTRLFTGKDIRQLGSGNVGGNNVFREVGAKASVPTAFFDVGKGALAVTIAHWLLDVPFYRPDPDLYVLLAALAVIAGHMWSIYLKFSGGNGLSATFGALAILLPRELLIVIALLLILRVITRNTVLSVNIALLSVPISSWLMEDSLLYVYFSIIIAIMLVLNFLPVAKAAISQAESKKNLADDLLRKTKE